MPQQGHDLCKERLRAGPGPARNRPSQRSCPCWGIVGACKTQAEKKRAGSWAHVDDAASLNAAFDANLRTFLGGGPGGASGGFRGGFHVVSSGFRMPFSGFRPSGPEN